MTGSAGERRARSTADRWANPRAAARIPNTWDHRGSSKQSPTDYRSRAKMPYHESTRGKPSLAVAHTVQDLKSQRFWLTFHWICHICLGKWCNDVMIHPPSICPSTQLSIHLSQEEGCTLDESPAHRRANMDTERTEVAIHVLGEEARVPGENIQTPDRTPWPAGNSNLAIQTGILLAVRCAEWWLLPPYAGTMFL